MKNLKIASLKFAGLVASLALLVAAAASNTACMYWFHQPQAPQGLNRFKK